jgi:hypothetical protein
MTTLQLKTDKNLNLELWEEYYAFKWRQKLKKEVMLRGAVLFGIAFLALFALTLQPFFLIAVACTVSFLIYSIDHFFRVKKISLKHLKQSKIVDYEFGFSDNGITYKSSDAETKLDWSYFKFYETNGTTIYLYNNSGTRMSLLLTDRIMGENSFIEISKIVYAKVPQKK